MKRGNSASKKKTAEAGDSPRKGAVAAGPAGEEDNCLSAAETIETTFTEIASLIQTSRARAYQAVNRELIDLYWEVGRVISGKIAAAEWGDKVVEELAQFLMRREPGLKGFARANLFRMRQFYETYRDDEMVAALRRQLSWTHHRIIMGQSKSAEEREFYLRLAVREGWSSRELERQFRLARFETTATHFKLTTDDTDLHRWGSRETDGFRFWVSVLSVTSVV